MKRNAMTRTAALLLCSWLLTPLSDSLAEAPGGMGGMGGTGGMGGGVIESTGDFQIDQSMLMDTEATADAMGGDMSSAMAGMSSSSAASMTAAAAAYNGGGTSSGTSTANRTVSHSKSSTSSTLPYNALELTVENEQATLLTLGGETLSLSMVDSDMQPIPFTTAFAAWGAGGLETQAEDADGVDTLLLKAEQPEGSWLLNGTALKKLKDSGIKYLVLQAGDTVLVLPTAGFVAGLKQDQWKSQGLTGKYYTYTVTMQGGAAELTLTVTQPGGEAEACLLTDDSTQLVYTQGLLLGGPEILTLPAADPK